MCSWRPTAVRSSYTFSHWVLEKEQEEKLSFVREFSGAESSPEAKKCYQPSQHKLTNSGRDLGKVAFRVSPRHNQHIIPIRIPEAPLLWPPDAKSRLIRKDPDAGKD